MRRKPGEIYEGAPADEDREEVAEQPRYRMYRGCSDVIGVVVAPLGTAIRNRSGAGNHPGCRT